MILSLICAGLLMPQVSAVFFCPENPATQVGGVCSERCDGSMTCIGDDCKCGGRAMVPFPPQCCSSTRPLTDDTLRCQDGGCVMAGYAADTSSEICTCWSTCAVTSVGATPRCNPLSAGSGWKVDKPFAANYQSSDGCSFTVRTHARTAQSSESIDAIFLYDAILCRPSAISAFTCRATGRTRCPSTQAARRASTPTEAGASIRKSVLREPLTRGARVRFWIAARIPSAGRQADARACPRRPRRRNRR